MRKWSVVLSLIAAVVSVAVEESQAQTTADGLRAPAKVIRDSSGIPHIFAANDHDLHFMLGWVHAEDRFFQMDVLRRQASGTLAELLGIAALPGDVEARTIGLGRAAKRSWPILAPTVRAALKAYAKGVNAFLGKHPLPLEYGLLELTRVPAWTEIDTLTVSKGLSFELSFDLDIERTIALLSYQGAGVALGFDGTALFFEDLFRSEPFDQAATVPDARQASGLLSRKLLGPEIGDVSHHVTDSALALAKDYLKRVRDLPFFRNALRPRGEKPGSNQWVVAGRHTESGYPLLANDPHLPLLMPAVFYQVHLVSPQVDVIGSSLPGGPFVLTGHNKHIAWGPTTNFMDVTDVYEELVEVDPASPSGLSIVHEDVREPIIPIPVEFAVNVINDGNENSIVPVTSGVPSEVLIVPRRNHGPIIAQNLTEGTALSVQYVGFSGTREVQAFFLWNRARNLADFKKGLKFFDVGSQNWVYADKRGNIAYFVSGELPLREDLQAGTVVGAPPFFIRNGESGNEWVPLSDPQPDQAIPFEILPFREMPKLVNPPAGFIVNANNDPLGLTLDNDPLDQFRDDGGILYFAYGGAYQSFRAERITQMIEDKLASGDGKISFEEMKAMQADTVMRDAQVFVPYILAAFDNAFAVDADRFLAGLAKHPGVVEAVGRLRAWNFTTPTGLGPDGYDAGGDDPASSIAATIYSVWRSRILANTVDAFVDKFGLPKPQGPETRNALRALRNLLDNFDTNQGKGESGIDFFIVPGVDAPAEQRRDILLLKSVQDALMQLSSADFEAAFDNSIDQDDYLWGRLHRVVLDHPLGPPFSAPPAGLGGGAFPPPLPDLDGIPTDGGYQTVDRSDSDPRANGSNAFMFEEGPAQRMVVEVTRKGPKAESSLPGGQSGDILSPFYVSLLEEWLLNDTHDLLVKRAAIKADAVSEETFVPASDDHDDDDDD